MEGAGDDDIGGDVAEEAASHISCNRLVLNARCSDTFRQALLCYDDPSAASPTTTTSTTSSSNNETRPTCEQATMSDKHDDDDDDDDNVEKVENRKAKFYIWRLFTRHSCTLGTGTAEARISYGHSVCLSVCHDPVVYQAQVR